MCPDVTIVAVGFPTIDALHVLDGMGMLGSIIDGSIVTSDPERRDIEVALARGSMSLGKKVEDLADDIRSMRADLKAQKVDASIKDSLDRLAALTVQRALDDKAREDKFEEVRQSVGKMKGSVKQVSGNLTNMHNDTEKVMGKSFAQALKRSSYTRINLFPFNVFEDLDGDSVLEIDYMVSAVKDDVKYVFVLEVKSHFKAKYFGKMKHKMQVLDECVRIAYANAPDEEPDCNDKRFDVQNQLIRKFFGRDFVLQPVIAAPYVCDDDVREAAKLKYWLWMRSDQGYDVIAGGKSFVADSLPVPEVHETAVLDGDGNVN